MRETTLDISQGHLTTGPSPCKPGCIPLNEGALRKEFTLCLFEIGKIFICDGFTYLCEREMYWENNLKILIREKKWGPGGEAPRIFL